MYDFFILAFGIIGFSVITIVYILSGFSFHRLPHGKPIPKRGKK